MNFDLLKPLGALSALYGLLLSIYGLMSDPAIYERSLGININLRVGLALLGLGALTLAIAWRRPRGPR